ncbi:MAG: hypothetical protein WAM60_12990 [Candidatus Promineifilaceae bacterium]
MKEKQNRDEGPEVDIEAIMRDVRAEILTKKSARIQNGPLSAGVGGRRFPPAFYDHLYEAGLTFDVSTVELHVTRIPVPIIGSIIEKLRQKLHELVLFYVNKLAAEQAEVNEHLLSALSILSQELEQMPDWEDNQSSVSTTNQSSETLLD